MAIDKTDAAKEIDNAENVPGLVAHVKRKFTSAEDGKNEDESRWLKLIKIIVVFLIVQHNFVLLKNPKSL